MKTLANLLLFQLTWVAAVGGAGYGMWWPGLVMLGVFMLWHRLAEADWRSDLTIAGVLSVIGFAADSALLQAGVLQYATAVPSVHVAPIWIVVLWAGFALTLNHSMKFLHGKPIWAALFGLLGGPLAYWVAANVWHAASFGDARTSLIALGLVWAVLTPAAMALAAHLRRPIGSPAAP
ncbi:MAG: DUF2878 domain-containing protein [Xanthomonadales bacterium]|nr:DUF2878 domain-containing protein [Xanthomonadales bacterium]